MKKISLDRLRCVRAIRALGFEMADSYPKVRAWAAANIPDFASQFAPHSRGKFVAKLATRLDADCSIRDAIRAAEQQHRMQIEAKRQRKAAAKRAENIRKQEERRQKNLARVAREAFYLSQEWRELRYKVLVKYGARCQCCGATPADGVKMHVDHIKPRFHFPELSLAESNLQVLCEPCNLGKRHLDATDWRPQESC